MGEVLLYLEPPGDTWNTYGIGRQEEISKKIFRPITNYFFPPSFNNVDTWLD